MKYNTANNKKQQLNRAFTLIEMIGVLAVIAILAAVLVPKVFEAINNSRINNASMSCDTVKTAIADHYAKAGTLAVDASGATPVVLTLPYANFDQILIKEQFLDKAFATKIGDGSAGTLVKAIDCSGFTLGAAVTGADNEGYALAGGATNNVVGTTLVEAVITNVVAADAQALSARMDGPAMSQLPTSLTTPDTAGRVKYATPVNGVTTVYVYLTHR